MKKTVIICATLFLFISCKRQVVPNLNEVQSSIKVENGRLAFKSTQDYINTLDYLFKMNDKTLDEWEAKYNFSSIRKYFNASFDANNKILNSFENASPSWQATLNTNCEVLIGDTIVWFNGGIKHYIPNKNEALLQSIKRNPANSRFTSEYSIKLQDKKKAQVAERIIIGSNTLDARWQKKITYYKGSMNVNAGERKYVHEIVTSTQGFGCTPQFCDTYSQINLRVKLEYRDSRGNYPPAGEYRSVTLNIVSTDAYYRPSYFLTSPWFAGTTYINEGPIITNGNLVRGIASGYGPNYSGYPAVWDVDISGSIYHYILDDALLSNRWNNEAYPLW